MLEPLVQLTHRVERGTEVEAKIDRLLQPCASVGQVPRDSESLLQAVRRFLVRRARHRIDAGRVEIGRRLVPHLALAEM